MECKEGIVLPFRGFQFCINRNIVECKVVSLSDFMLPSSFVLIETLWNVKIFPIVESILVSFCINRNIVECKDTRLCNRSKYVRCINRNIVECKGVSACHKRNEH